MGEGNMVAYNNTIVDNMTGNSGFRFFSTSGSIARNNILYQTGGASQAMEVETANNNSLYTSSPPFLNPGGDFRLSGALAGASLSSTYNQDMLGSTRGSDGVWDRGAYEYNSGSPPSDTTAPTMSNASPSGTVTCTSDPMNVTESFVTNENATGRGSDTNQSYDDMGAGKNYTTTGGTTHSRTTSRACGATYTVYSQASDPSGNDTSTALVTSYTIGVWDPGEPTLTIQSSYSFDVNSVGTKFYHDGGDWVGRGANAVRTVNMFPTTNLKSDYVVSSVEARFYVQAKSGSPGTLSITRYGSSHGQDNAAADSGATAYSSAAGTEYATVSEPTAGAWTAWTSLGPTAVVDLQYCINNSASTWTIGTKASSGVEGGSTDVYVDIDENSEAHPAEIRVKYGIDNPPPTGAIYFGADRSGAFLPAAGGPHTWTFTAP